MEGNRSRDTQHLSRSRIPRVQEHLLTSSGASTDERLYQHCALWCAYGAAEHGHIGHSVGYDRGKRRTIGGMRSCNIQEGVDT